MSFYGFHMLSPAIHRKVFLFRCGICFEFSAQNFECVQYASHSLAMCAALTRLLSLAHSLSLSKESFVFAIRRWLPSQCVYVKCTDIFAMVDFAGALAFIARSNDDKLF